MNRLLSGAVAALLLALPAHGKDLAHAIHLEWEQEDRKAAADAYGKLWRAKSPEAAEAARRHVRLLLGQGKAKEAKRLLGEIEQTLGKLDAELSKLAKDPSSVPRDRDVELRRLLARPLALRLSGNRSISFEEILDLLRSATGINFVVLDAAQDELGRRSGGLDTKAQAELMKQSNGRDALDVLTKRLGLEWRSRHGFVVIGLEGQKKGRLQRLSVEEIRGARPLYANLGRSVSLNVTDTALADVLTFLGQISQLNIVPTEELEVGDLTLTLRAKKVRLIDALRAIAALSGAEVELRSGLAILRSRGSERPEVGWRGLAGKNAALAKKLATRVDLRLKNETSLTEVFAQLGKAAGLTLRPTKAVLTYIEEEDRVWSHTFHQVPAGEILVLALEDFDLEVRSASETEVVIDRRK